MLVVDASWLGAISALAACSGVVGRSAFRDWAPAIGVSVAVFVIVCLVAMPVFGVLMMGDCAVLPERYRH
jgi:hypothetical protein